MTVDPTKYEFSPEEIARELGRRRRIYTRLFELTPPDGEDRRSFYIENPCNMFEQPMAELRDKLGIVERDQFDLVLRQVRVDVLAGDLELEVQRREQVVDLDAERFADRVA